MEYILIGQTPIIKQDGGRARKTKNKEYQNKINELNKLFLKAKAYSSSRFWILEWKVCRDYLTGKSLYVHANSVSDIRDAIEFFII